MHRLPGDDRDRHRSLAGCSPSCSALRCSQPWSSAPGSPRRSFRRTSRARAAGERRRDRRRSVRDHPHVRPRLRRAFQPDRLDRGCDLRRALPAGCARLPPRAGHWVASLGALAANAMFASAALSISTHHRASPAHLLAEIDRDRSASSLVIFALARSHRAPQAPSAVGAYIGAAYWFTSSSSFANPAITIGRMLSNSFAGIAPASGPGFIVAQVARRTARRRRRSGACIRTSPHARPPRPCSHTRHEHGPLRLQPERRTLPDEPGALPTGRRGRHPSLSAGTDPAGHVHPEVIDGHERTRNRPL